MAREDVKEYIFGVLDKLASDYKIRYFKWDMNRIFRRARLAGSAADRAARSCG